MSTPGSFPPPPESQPPQQPPPPPPATGPSYPGQQPLPQPSPRNNMGLAGLILGVLSFLSCGLLAPVGIIVSLLGLRKKPKGMAIAGLVISVVSLLQLLILVAIAVPGFLRARAISERNACQENLSKIDGAKQQWALETNQYGNAVPTGGDLVGADLYIRKSPVCPGGGVYTIGSVEENPACSHSTDRDFPHTFPDSGW